MMLEKTFPKTDVYQDLAKSNKQLQPRMDVKKLDLRPAFKEQQKAFISSKEGSNHLFPTF